MRFEIVFIASLLSVICRTERICKIPSIPSIIHATSYSSRFKRSAPDTGLKFLIEYTSSFQSNPLFEQIKTKIVLPALTYWEQTLGVKKLSSENIVLERQCLNGQTSYVKWPNGTIGTYCNSGCENITRCFTEPIPSNYLNPSETMIYNRYNMNSFKCDLQVNQIVSRYAEINLWSINNAAIAAIKINFTFLKGCKQLSGNHPTIQGDRGLGIPPNGYLIFVDASQSEPCQSDDLLAYALACQLEYGTDRPVAGYVNMCPNQLSVTPAEVRSTISTFIHEMAHALGFSSTSYAFLRDENGIPRTPRDPNTGLPALGQDADYIYKASTSTVAQVERIWVSAASTTVRKINAFVLPSVLAEARAHYNCPTMDGMDLEDDGGAGTAFVHFEKRITEDELMSGSYSKDSYVSTLTLAYFKDTGWYTVNMSMAQIWRFGKNWGCEFVLRSCYEYMRIRLAMNTPITPYCNKLSSTDIKCLNYDDAFGFCDLQRQKDKLPPENQYFTSIDGVASSEVPYYGGGSTLNDWCPIYRVSYSFSKTLKDSQVNYALQYFGDDSICVNHDTYSQWISVVGGFYRYLTFPYASCHKYNCTSSGIKLIIGNQIIDCPSDGDLMPINAYDNSINVRGLLLCPTCSGVCSVCSNKRPSLMSRMTCSKIMLLIPWITQYIFFKVRLFMI
ncbi:Leishmanolysin-like peptidase [Schistosoma japonicum]|nr:Leishmanolysin-like peptidase [Schistosoma japonicum]